MVFNFDPETPAHLLRIAISSGLTCQHQAAAPFWGRQSLVQATALGVAQIICYPIPLPPSQSAFPSDVPDLLQLRDLLFVTQTSSVLGTRAATWSGDSGLLLMPLLSPRSLLKLRLPSGIREQREARSLLQN